MRHSLPQKIQCAGERYALKGARSVRGGADRKGFLRPRLPPTLLLRDTRERVHQLRTFPDTTGGAISCFWVFGAFLPSYPATFNITIYESNCF
jgi:hypothetical protein